MVVAAHTFNPSTLGRWISEFEASLVYKLGLHRKTLSKKSKYKTNKKSKQRRRWRRRKRKGREGEGRSRNRKDHHGFKSSLGYTLRPCLKTSIYII